MSTFTDTACASTTFSDENGNSVTVVDLVYNDSTFEDISNGDLDTITYDDSSYIYDDERVTYDGMVVLAVSTRFSDLDGTNVPFTDITS